jgi:hypothetical protein
MTINVDIDRLNISLHGLSAQLIEEATQGLDKELSRRLGMHGLGQHLSAGSMGFQIDHVSLDSIQVNNSIGSATLRALIAERLLEAIGVQQPTPSSTVEKF